MGTLLDIGLGWVLPQSTKTLTNLVQLDLPITSVIEQIEGFLEFCEEKNGKFLLLVTGGARNIYPQQMRILVCLVDRTYAFCGWFAILPKIAQIEIALNLVVVVVFCVCCSCCEQVQK